MEFRDIIGKTIKNVQHLKLKQYDDSGYLLMEFTDGEKCMIIGDYGLYTGNAQDEYPTNIGIYEGIDLEKFEEIK